MQLADVSFGMFAVRFESSDFSPPEFNLHIQLARRSGAHETSTEHYLLELSYASSKHVLYLLRDYGKLRRTLNRTNVFCNMLQKVPLNFFLEVRSKNQKVACHMKLAASVSLFWRMVKAQSTERQPHPTFQFCGLRTKKHPKSLPETQ